MKAREATNSLFYPPLPFTTYSSLGVSGPASSRERSPFRGFLFYQVSFSIRGTIVLADCRGQCLRNSLLCIYTPLIQLTARSLGFLLSSPTSLLNPVPLQPCPSPLKRFQPTFTEQLLSEPMLGAENKAISKTDMSLPCRPLAFLQ